MYINKEKIIRDIKDFIGEGGYLPLTEHGYDPTFNAFAVDYNGIYKFTTGGFKPFEDMMPEALVNLVLEIFRYQNYCRLHA